MSNSNVLDGKWLLIVDDEPDVLETLTDIRQRVAGKRPPILARF